MALNRIINIIVNDKRFVAHRRQMQGYLTESRGGFRLLSGAVDGLSGRFPRLGGAARGALGGLAAILTVIVAGFARATKLAVAFETAMTGVAKTVDATETEFAELEAGIRRMAKEVPATTTEIARVAEAAGQLGIQTDAILGFTETMIALGVATNLSADQAATSLARLANITQLPQDQFERLGSTVVDLGNNLATTEAEIIDMALRLAGVGTTVGLTEAQILGISGALSSLGVQAELGGSTLSRILLEMQEAVAGGGKALENFADGAGVSAREFAEVFERDASEALVKFLKGLRRLSDSDVVRVLDRLETKGIRVRDVILRLSNAGNLLADAIDRGSEAWKENIALTEEAARRYATTASQFEIFINRLRDFGIELGERILPVVNSLLESISDTVAALDSPTENLLRILDRQAGIDPLIIAELRVQLDRETLAQTKQEALKELQDIGTVKTNITFQPGSLPDATRAFFDEIEAADLSIEELIEHTNGYVTELTKLREVDVSTLNFFTRQRFNQQIQFFEEQIERIKLVIEARATLQVTNQDLLRTEEQLASIRAGNLPPSTAAAGIAPPPEEEDTLGGLSEEEQRRLERAREKALAIVQKIAQANELAASFTDEERQALAEVFRIQAEILRLKKAEAVLGEEATREALVGAELRLRAARATLAVQEQFNDRIREAAGLFVDVLGNIGFDPRSEGGFAGLPGRGVEGPLDAFLDRRRREAEEARAGFRDPDAPLRLDPALQDEWDRLLKVVRRTNEAWEFSFEVMSDLADLIGGFGRLVDIFGDLSDEVRDFTDGLADAVFSAARLRKLVVEADPVTGLSTGGQIAAGGAALGIFSGLVQIGQAFTASGREQREEMRRLRAALRESARATRELVAAMFDQAIIGADVAQATLERARDIISELLTSSREGRLAGDTVDVRGLLEELEDTGLPIFQGLSDIVADLTERFGSVDEALQHVFLSDEFANIADAIAQQLGLLGTFSDTIGGAIEKLGFLTDFIGLEGQAAFEAFIGALSDISDLPASLLDQIAGLDISTAEGRARLNEIIAATAQAVASGQFNFGGLSPDEIRSLLDTLQSFAEGGGGITVGGDTTTQVQRFITESQAPLVIDALNTIAFWTRRTAEILETITGAGARAIAPPPLPVIGPPPSALSIPRAPLGIGGRAVNISVQRTLEPEDELDRFIAEAVERETRKRGYFVTFS